MSRTRIGIVLAKLASIFTQPSSAKKRRTFRPTLESLECRFAPATLDYWQPPNPVTDIKWSTASNWSLGHAPVGNSTTSEVAEFDNLHTNGNNHCTMDVDETPYGTEFAHTWSKTLTIAAGKLLDNYAYFNATGTSTPDIWMGSTASIIKIEAHGSTVSSFNGGHIGGSHGLFKNLSTVGLGIGTGGYCDSDFYNGDSLNDTALAVFYGTGGTFTIGKDNDVLFRNYGIMRLWGSTTTLIQNGTGTLNTYLNNIGDGTGGLLTTDDFDGSSCKVDIPMYNFGGVFVMYGDMRMLGTTQAQSCGNYHFINNTGNFKFSSINGTGKATLTMTCPTSGCVGFEQIAGVMKCINSSNGGLSVDGANVNNARIDFTGGQVDLSGSLATLTVTSAASGLNTSTMTATNTSFLMDVSALETVCSTISVDHFAVTVDTTDTCYVYNGFNGSPGKGITEVMLSVTNGSLTGDWSWNWTATLNSTGWSDNSAGNNLSTVHN